MSTAREEILASIRRSLKRRTALDPSIQRMLDMRFAQHEAHVSTIIKEDLVERFAAKLQAVAGSVSRVAKLEDVPEALTQYLNSQSLPLLPRRARWSCFPIRRARQRSTFCRMCM